MPDANDQQSAAQQRASELLIASLRDEPVAPRKDLTGYVMSTARWQYTARSTLVALNDLGGAVADGLSIVFGGKRGGRR